MAESRPLSSKSSRSKSVTGKETGLELIGKSQLQPQPGAKERQKRVKSAKLNREKNNSSTKVFPRPRSAEKKERYTSMYNRDFEGSYQPPTEPRPTSPTRRNNPHPSQQFMVWRVPSREVGGQNQPIRMGSGLPGPRKLSGQYDDNEFDEFETYDQYDKLRVPLPEPSSKDYGAYLRQMRAAAALQQQQQMMGGGDRMPSRQSQRGDFYSGPPPPGHVHHVGADVLSRTLKNDSDPGTVGDWMQTASPQEQQTILKMLKEAENAQVKQTITSVMQPEAAKYVKGWMQTANDQERDVAMRLFSSLGSRKGPRQRSLSESAIRPPSRSQKIEEHRLSNPSVDGKPWPKSLWHHLPVRDPPPRVYHRGSLFGKGSGGASHYNIHPEWPDYEQSTFSPNVH